MRRVLLVGATDGIGLALAHAFVGRGWAVGLTGRNRDKVSDAVETILESCPQATVRGGVLDVTRFAEVPETLSGVAGSLGGIDLVVYCAGILEETRTGAGRMMDTNVTGAIEVLEWAAEGFVARRAGHLAAIGSVAGDRGRAGNPAYGASKAALHAYLEGLRHRLHGCGVRVTTIKPGWVRTRMLGDVPGFPPTVSPEEAAQRIVRGLERGKEVFFVPGFWRWVSLALRAMPRFLFKRLAPP